MRTLRESAVGIVVLWLFLYGCGATLLADGCYFPDRAVRKLPEIPIQRALLSWKDGTETLVVASALDSEAQKLGWLIPLPSVPREMTKADPGALKTLAFCVQPRITHDLSRAARAVTLLISWVVLGAVIAAFRERLLVWFLVITLLLLTFGSLLLPTLGTEWATVANVANVRVEKTAKVGAYEISVLKAGGTVELNRWLTENGLTPLPAAAEPMVADYVRRGWMFAAIKLTRAESGSNTPHPIKLVFSAREAVYPWKLTTLAGGRPFLELFVVGPSRAAVGGLKTEFCQRLRINGKVFNAEQAKVAIGHPEITPLLWDGCVLTKLSGHLDARRQADDLPVHWTEFDAYQQHFYSTTGAGFVAWMVFVSVLGIICAPGLIVCSAPDGLRFDRRFYFRTLVPRTLLAAFLASTVTYASLPKLRASDTQVIRRDRVISHAFPLAVKFGIQRILEQEPDLRQQDERAITDAILNRLPATMSVGGWSSGQSRLTNLLQGGEVQPESSPGNFTIEKRGGKIIVRAYDQTGCPLVDEY